jgi:hypothetical protein
MVRRRHHDQRRDAVLLGPGRGLHPVAAGRGGVTAQRDPLTQGRHVDPGEVAEGGEIGAAADPAEQQPVRPAAGEQMQGQFHPSRPAGQSDNAVGVGRRQFRGTAGHLNEPGEAATPAAGDSHREPQQQTCQPSPLHRRGLTIARLTVARLTMARLTMARPTMARPTMARMAVASQTFASQAFACQTFASQAFACQTLALLAIAVGA